MLIRQAIRYSAHRLTDTTETFLQELGSSPEGDMDDLLNMLLSFPPYPPPPNPLTDQQYDEAIKLHIDHLRRTPTKSLLQMSSGGEHILNVVNPGLNTVSYVYVLLANINAWQKKTSNSQNWESLWEKIGIFIHSFDPRQIRYLGHELGEVITALVEIARHTLQPGIAVPLINTAILRVDPSGTTLTSNHLLLIRLALETGMHAAALPVLERSVRFFPGGTQQPRAKYLCSLSLPGQSYISRETGLTQKLKYQDVLEYFIFSGTIYIALRKWEEALDILESAITYPVKDVGASKIMVEAYKKWVLVNILMHGKNGALPSTVSSPTAKQFHTVAKPYDVVATLFETASAARLNAEVQRGVEIWREDGNTGLMMLVLASYQKFQIRNLANVYCTISISEITCMTVSAETGRPLPSDEATESLITSMIDSGELHATIAHAADSPAVLTFNATGPVLSECEVQRHLASCLEQIKSMTDDIKHTDQRLTREKEYLKWAYKNKRKGKNGTGDPSTGDDMILNSIDDEDLMGGAY